MLNNLQNRRIGRFGETIITKVDKDAAGQINFSVKELYAAIDGGGLSRISVRPNGLILGERTARIKAKSKVEALGMAPKESIGGLGMKKIPELAAELTTAYERMCTNDTLDEKGADQVRLLIDNALEKLPLNQIDTRIRGGRA